MAKLAEDDRIEQMNAQKRRMKQLEHKRAVEKLLEDRLARFEAERERIPFIARLTASLSGLSSSSRLTSCAFTDPESPSPLML